MWPRSPKAQIRLAASNEELEMKARIDVLTHLWNRGAIMEPAESELAAGPRAPAAVLMIDVDHFKSINDRFGHPTGDQMLWIVAATLRAGLAHADHALSRAKASGRNCVEAEMAAVAGA